MAIRVTRYFNLQDLVGEPLARGREHIAICIDARTHYDPICEQLKKERSIVKRRDLEARHAKELRGRSEKKWDLYYCIDADWTQKWFQFINERDESKL